MLRRLCSGLLRGRVPEPWSLTKAALGQPVRSASSQAAEVLPENELDAEAPPEYVDDDSAEIVQEPWTYNLTEIPPDTTATLLSDATKERMYTLHQQDPATWNPARLARDHRIRLQRVHAILWLKELEKKAEAENGGPLDDSLVKLFEANNGTVEKAVREQHIAIFPSEEVDAIEDPDKRTRKLLEQSQREEVYLVEDFLRRMNFNKLQMSGQIKVNPLDRRRPKEGWSYMVEELGDEERRGRSGGKRYVVGPDGSKRALNEVEKQFLEREKVRRRRRIEP